MVLTCGSLSGALIRTMHRPIRPVQRIQPTEFLIVRLHPIVTRKNVALERKKITCIDTLCLQRKYVMKKKL